LCGFIGYEGSCLHCTPDDGFMQGLQEKAKRDPNMCAIKIPYASKLMLQELQAMNIRTQIKLSDK